MAARKWYSQVLIAAVVVIGAGAAFSIPSIRGWHIWGPWSKRPVAVAKKPVAKKPVAKVPVAAPAQQTSVQPTMNSGEVTVAEKAPVKSPSAPRAKAVAKWAPSERQRLRDAVYLAGKDNRINDAIAALEAWDAKHPSDPEVLRELARLLARSSRPADAFARYRELLAISPDTAVRAEYAAALLALQQYDSAAANYRILIAADSTSLNAHLGLARALAWSNHPREAEPELHWLVSLMPEDTLLVTMLHVARNSYDPPSSDAAFWVVEDPTYVPYRLSLARSLVRERHPELSLVHFDTLLAATSAPSVSLVREAASAHAAAGDSVGTARMYARAVALAPSDRPQRQSYAEVLSWSGDRPAAIAQYDTLLAEHADADLLMARGRMYGWSGNLPMAERDVAASAALKPSAENFAMLGDLYRWRGERVQSRAAYTRARVLNPGDAQATAGLAALDLADLREAEAFFDNDVGFTPFASYLGDNAGFALSTAGLSGGFVVGSRAALTFSADERRLNDANGQAAGLGLVTRLGMFRLAGDGGFTRYDDTGDFGFGSLTASGPLRRVWTSFGLRTGPTYQWLMSSGRLTYSGASVSATVPFRWAALSAGVDQMWLSDGNARTSLQFGARYPIGFGVSALYSGGVIGFDHASTEYWDPHRFTSHAVGLEFATRTDSGFSFSARVLPGIGMSADVINGNSDREDRRASQLSSGFALDYRRRWWTLTFDGEYAQGVRESHYHSARAGFRLRITP
jgi:tetratricopeptide (TPR) repeat protein